MRYLIILCLLLCIGCVSMPKEVRDSIKTLHASNVIICDDYADLLPLKYADDELAAKLKIVEKHLKLSKELYDYVKDLED